MTQFDIQNLNNSIAGVGNAFAERRKEQRDDQKLAIEQDMRQQMLESELRRAKTEEDRTANEKTKLGQQDDEHVFKDMITVNPYLTDDSRASANKYLAKHPKWGAVGIQLKAPDKKPVPRPGQSAGVAELTTAREFRDKAASAGPEMDAETKSWYVKAAEALEKRAEQTKPDPTQFEEVTEKVPGAEGSPEIPAQPGTGLRGVLGLGKAAQPAVPAVPGVPERTIKRKVPIGGAPAPAAAPSSGSVQVQHPDGRTGTIPAANLPAALKAGFKQVQ